MNEYQAETPYLHEMDNILRVKMSEGTTGIRLFVQQSLDVFPDDIARDFRAMELARVGRPYYTSLRI